MQRKKFPSARSIVRAGRIIARAFNQVEIVKDATAHAEMLALTQAEEVVGDWRLTDCTLYVTKEPCPMCAGAIVHVRLARVVFGASDLKGGAAGSAMNLLQFPTLNHQCQITQGVREPECASLLRSFFAEQRAKNKTDNGKSFGGNFRARIAFAQLTDIIETFSFFSFRAIPCARGSSVGLPST